MHHVDPLGRETHQWSMHIAAQVDNPVTAKRFAPLHLEVAIVICSGLILMVPASPETYLPAVTFDGVRSMEAVGVPLSHPLTGWD